jgi:hypothetical protein
MKVPLALGVALLGIAGVAGALVIARVGSEDEPLSKPTPSLAVCDARETPPDQQLWRWMDLAVLLPKEGFGAHPDYIAPEPQRPNGGQGLRTYKFDPSDPSNPNVGASVLIDAETGAIVHTGGPEHGKIIGIALCPLDPATSPWPYNGDPPHDWKVAGVELTGKWPYTPPDPGSGMYADFVSATFGCSGDCPWVECALLFESIGVRNGRSQAFIGMDSVSGAVCKQLTNVHPDDLAAFERFLDRAEQCMLGVVEC